MGIYYENKSKSKDKVYKTVCRYNYFVQPSEPITVVTENCHLNLHNFRVPIMFNQP